MDLIVHSIQEYLKKINSVISIVDCISILISTLSILSFLLFLYIKNESSSVPTTYTSSEVNGGQSSNENYESRPFASKNGKTYTFSWCQGSSVIAVKNKIYFDDESSAQNSGRTLSKLCQK